MLGGFAKVYGLGKDQRRAAGLARRIRGGELARGCGVEGILSAKCHERLFMEGDVTTYPKDRSSNGDPSKLDILDSLLGRVGSCSEPYLNFLAIPFLIVIPAADGASGDVARRLVNIMAVVCGCEKIQS